MGGFEKILADMVMAKWLGNFLTVEFPKHLIFLGKMYRIINRLSEYISSMAEDSTARNHIVAG